MTKPEPASIDLAQIRRLAEQVIAVDRFPFLATMEDDQPRLRPVSPVRTAGFQVYVANLRQYHKTTEIEQNPKIELCYMDQEHNQVRITGVAKVLQNKELIQEIWDSNPLLRHYLGTPDNPQLIIYCIEPNRVRYMQEWALEYHEVPLD